jgi:hypothetical protein
MRSILLLAASAALAATGAPATAATTIYTSQSAFLAALSSSTVEDFSDTTYVPGLTITSTYGGTAGSGVFNDQVDGFTGYTTTFDLASGIYAFGFNLDETPNDFGAGINLTLTPGGLLPVTLSGYTGGFFGFISDTAFTSVLFSAPGQGVETYSLDNLTFSSAVAAVPEPAAWLMMIFGFGVAGGAVRRRKRAAQAFA